uniref:HicB family protein n=1 Tax=Escherichia coli TaxID=562 RepID=A0A1W5W6N7_ECOLX|nr:hicB family protein [Escherichia coli]
MKHLKYKGYLGTVEPDFENNVLYGKLAFIRDLVTYEASTLAELDRSLKHLLICIYSLVWRMERNLIPV